MDDWDAEPREAVQTLIPEVEGRPCVNVGDHDGGVHVCRRISGLEIDEESFKGTCEWVDPEDARPDELNGWSSAGRGCEPKLSRGEPRGWRGTSSLPDGTAGTLLTRGPASPRMGPRPLGPS